MLSYACGISNFRAKNIQCYFSSPSLLLSDLCMSFGYFRIILYKLPTLTTYVRGMFCIYMVTSSDTVQFGIARSRRSRRCELSFRRKSCVPRPKRKHTRFSFNDRSFENFTETFAKHETLRESVRACQIYFRHVRRHSSVRYSHWGEGKDI